MGKMLAATTHLGSDNSEVQMEQYIFKRRQDGVHIINLKKTWEKLMLAARAIAAIENPADVFVVCARPYGQRAVLKFARYIGAVPIAGRFTPGAFTTDWANEPAPGLGAPGMAPKPVAYPPPVTDDWASQVPQTSDWAADAPAPAADSAAAAPANQWGGSSNWN